MSVFLQNLALARDAGDGTHTAWWGQQHRTTFIIAQKDGAGVVLYYEERAETEALAIAALNAAWAGRAGLTYKEYNELILI